MRGLTFAAACIIACSAEPSYTEVREIIKQCVSGNLHKCAEVQAIEDEHADNLYCGTLELAGEEHFKSHWLPYCKLASSCDIKSDKPPVGIKLRQVAQITDVNYLDEISTMPKAVQDKIGKGPRRALMNPKMGGAVACRSLTQLSDEHNNKIYKADYFSYKETKDGHYQCDLYSTVPMAEVSSLAFSNGAVYGYRGCDCAHTEGVKCSPLSTSDDIIAACASDPSDPVCLKVDSDVGKGGSADGCMTGLNSGNCYKSDDLPRVCYKQVGEEVQLEDPVTVSDAASVKKFLIEAADGAFDEFAGYVGFERSSDRVNIRSRAVVPQLAGPVACRNLARLQGSLGQRYAVGDREYFFYDPVEKACSFVKSEPHTVQVLSSVYGPAYCA